MVHQLLQLVNHCTSLFCSPFIAKYFQFRFGRASKMTNSWVQLVAPSVSHRVKKFNHMNPQNCDAFPSSLQYLLMFLYLPHSPAHSSLSSSSGGDDFSEAGVTGSLPPWQEGQWRLWRHRCYTVLGWSRDVVEVGGPFQSRYISSPSRGGAYSTWLRTQTSIFI